VGMGCPQDTMGTAKGAGGGRRNRDTDRNSSVTMRSEPSCMPRSGYRSKSEKRCKGGKTPTPSGWTGSLRSGVLKYGTRKARMARD